MYLAWSAVPAPTRAQIVGKLLKGDTVVDTCHGNWLSHLEWDKGAAKGKAKKLWDIKGTRVTPALPSPTPLGSDCRHREDVVFLAKKDQVRWGVWWWRWGGVDLRVTHLV